GLLPVDQDNFVVTKRLPDRVKRGAIGRIDAGNNGVGDLCVIRGNAVSQVNERGGGMTLGIDGRLQRRVDGRRFQDQPTTFYADVSAFCGDVGAQFPVVERQLLFQLVL